MSAPRPNLLLITTDQQRWDALSLLGTAGYRTPNLDRLARLGVAFDNAYSPTPICTPARISMLTGTYPSTHGAGQVGVSAVPALSQPNLPSRLAAAGYRTACIGKTHFVARAQEDAHVAARPLDQKIPAEFWETFDGPYWGFDFVRHNGGHTNMRAPDGHYRAWLKRKGADLAAIDALHRPVMPAAPGCPMSIGRWDLPLEHHHNTFVTEEGLAWIERQGDAPWFAMLNYQDPHAPFVCPEPFYSAVDMSRVEIPSLRPGELDDKPPFYRSLVETGRYLDERGASLEDEKKLAGIFPYRFGDKTGDAIRAYIGMVNCLDVSIGRILDRLEASGRLRDTLVVFTSDHGELLGHHGMWEKGPCAYDDCQRIPALLAWPGAPVPERGLVPHHFNLVDIAPTFLAAAGVAPVVGMQGFNHLPYLLGDRAAVRDWSLVDFAGSSKLYQQTFVTNDWKLVLYRDQPWGELYDRRRDPRQFTNLFHSPGHAAIRAELTHRALQANLHASGEVAHRIAYA